MGPKPGTLGSGSVPRRRTLPTCHSCGANLPPAACPASTTFFQPASASSPWNCGTFGYPLAARVHGTYHRHPAREWFFTVWLRQVRIAVGGEVRHSGAFADDQADTGSGATAVVFHHLISGHTLGREVARHGRHHQARGQL